MQYHIWEESRLGGKYFFHHYLGFGWWTLGMRKCYQVSGCLSASVRRNEQLTGWLTLVSHFTDRTVTDNVTNRYSPSRNWKNSLMTQDIYLYTFMYTIHYSVLITLAMSRDEITNIEIWKLNIYIWRVLVCCYITDQPM